MTGQRLGLLNLVFVRLVLLGSQGFASPGCSLGGGKLIGGQVRKWRWFSRRVSCLDYKEGEDERKVTSPGLRAKKTRLLNGGSIFESLLKFLVSETDITDGGIEFQS